ncbi:MAG TPA: hypothetical protein VNJ08_12705 [Bacteriovoracaceae bacterium]|nr:hypothetical protein [Bacteriovoracaceae bacterium]
MKRTLKFKSVYACLLVLSTESFANTQYINGHIGALSNQANEEIGNVPGNRFNGNMFFDYHKDNSTTYTKDIERRFTIASQVNDQSLTTFSLQEAYVGGQLTKKDHLRLGRQILPWSTVDHVWGFGKLNNRRNFDFFDPGQEGLTGLLYERRSSNGMRYKAFASGIYVPELNPPLDIDKKDRTITSRHPWAEVPARTVEIEPGNWKTIAYDVDYPEPQDVIYRYTLGANIGYESKHWVMDNFVSRKPENTMSTKVSINLDPAADVIEAKITPQFYYHDVMGSTLKYRNKDIEMYVSGLAVRPNTYPDGDRDAIRATDIKTEKRREDYMGGGISRTNDLYGIGIHYVARLSPYDRSKESLSLDPRWNQAVDLFVMRNIGRKFSVSGDLKYDMLTTDRLTMFRASYKVSKEMQMSLGVNMIGTPSDGKSYWSPFTNNDAVYGALRYVF